MKIYPEWGCGMGCKCSMPASALRTPGRCSVTTTYSKLWKQQGVAQFPRSMPGRRRRTKWKGGRQLGNQWPRSSISSPQWGPHSTSSFIVSWPFISSVMRSPSSSWSALRLSELSPRKQLHASSHAASSSSTSTSASFSTSRGFWRADSIRYYPQDSNQRWAEISTRERTARELLECLGTQACSKCSSDHDAPDLKGQPVNFLFFRQHFKGITRAVVSVKGIEEWGAQGY